MLKLYLIITITLLLRIEASEETNDLQKTLIDLVHEIIDITNPNNIVERQVGKDTANEVQKNLATKLGNPPKQSTMKIFKSRVNQKKRITKRPGFNILRSIKQKINSKVNELLTDRTKYLNFRNRLDTGMNDFIDFDQLLFKTGLDIFEHLIPQADQLK